MTAIPPLPGKDSRDWYPHYQAVDRAARASSPTGDLSLSIACPSYFYPTWYAADQNAAAWARLQAAAPYARLGVINPASGPGTTVNSDYAEELKRSQAAGLQMLGYVSTQYGNRAPADVTADIERWYALYPTIDGIFLDEQANVLEHLAKYVDYYAKIKSMPGLSIVVANPGTTTPEPYMATSDILMNFENTLAAYRTRPKYDYEKYYPANRFWHIVYGLANQAEFDEALALARTYRAGNIYFTGDTLPNPYDTLTTAPYWAKLVGEAIKPTVVKP